MALTLTQDDINAISQNLYELILEGQSNSVEYGQPDNKMEPPTTEEERNKYYLGVIKDDGDTQESGNMNIEDLLTSFGADAKTQLQQYSNQTIKPSLDDYTNTKKSELDTKSVQLTDNFNNLVITKRNEFTVLATEKKTEITNIYNLAITLKGDIVELGDQYSINFRQVYSDTTQAKQAAILAKEAAQAAADQALAAVQRLPAGLILPFAGLQAEQPPYTLMCTGSTDLNPTDFPNLFKVIGTKYGGDGVNTFGIPDLITTVDGTADGNYIRYGNWDKLGQKIRDAIRNITASLQINGGQGAKPWCNTGGAIYSTTELSNVFLRPQDSPSGVETSEIVYLDANRGDTSSNLMSGHAVGPDIHPYSIYLVPLITY